MNAASPEAWTTFCAFLSLRRDESTQVGALAQYALRRWDTTRHDWRRDPSDFTARDLFDNVRRDWRWYGLGEHAIKQAVSEFLDWLWVRATGADCPRVTH